MSDDPLFSIVSGSEWLQHLAKHGITPEHLPAIKLDSARVPEQFRRWIPLAERWGIGDDVLREACVSHASPQELADLLSFAEGMDTVYNEWLAGSDSYNESPTAEYIAFSCLAMAWDSAFLRQSRSEIRP